METLKVWFLNQTEEEHAEKNDYKKTDRFF